MISAVILTKNEEQNIERCLHSLEFCDEIIIVDDFSKDSTLKKIENGEWIIENKNIKLKIYKRKLNKDFAVQRNFGLEKAKGEWVLFVDADEVISKELASEIKSEVSNLKIDKIVGFLLKRSDYFLGNWLQYGETGSVRLLRLVKKNAGIWKGKIHEVLEIKGLVKTLNNPLQHYPHPNISEFVDKVNWYTDIVAQYRIEQGSKVYFWEILIYPLGKFFSNYFGKMGFIDGVPGLIIAIMMSFHSFLVHGKLFFLQNE